MSRLPLIDRINGIIMETLSTHNMTHKKIHKFHLDGEFLSDADIPRLRSQYESMIVADMRSKGYIRVLDIDPAWSTRYNAEEDRWFFSLTIHGVFAGKRRAKVCEGTLDGNWVARSIQSIKSDLF